MDDTDFEDHESEEAERAREEAEARARHAAEGGFLDALAAHLRSPSDGTWSELKGAAGEAVRLGGGNLSHGVNWARDVDVRVGPLLERDSHAWGTLLHGLAGRLNDGARVAAIRDLSPYAGKALVFEQHGTALRRQRFSGDVAEVVERALEGHQRERLNEWFSLVAVDLPPRVTEPPQAEADGDVGC